MIAAWNDSFKTNIDIIDEQHKEIFRLLRDLEQMLLTNCVQYKYEDFLYTFCEIRDYVTYHFYTEEEYMLQIEYPDFLKQQEYHKMFTKEINKINYDELKIDSCKVIKEVKILIEDFIMHHILIEDTKIGKYHNKK